MKQDQARTELIDRTGVAAGPPATLFVLSHTHWDREWYKTAEAFRPWLVDLIDALLDAGVPQPFLLDGQAIVLEDYLASRPERAAELSSALQRGAIEAGPWYVLADLLIPSGEALVRNLLLGMQVLRALRASAPPVLYCPDAFGHGAAGPVLAAGFGFPLCIVWRGYGGRGWPDGDSARWRSASGDSVLLYHLPRDGYGFGANLPVDDASSAAWWRAIGPELGARSRLGFLLVLNGADHHAPQRDGEQAIAALTRAAAPSRVQRTGLTHFTAALVGRAASVHLPVVRGELRASPSYVWSLPGTLSARARQKRENAQRERLLVRDVEPWDALASFAAQWRAGGEVRSHWKSLLESHPHDTLCGCSVDAVARAMDARIEAVRLAAVETRGRALAKLLGVDAAVDRETGAVGETLVVLRNAAARERNGVVELTLDLPLADVPVGPESADRIAAPRVAPPFHVEGIRQLQVLRRDRTFVRDESPWGYPRNLLVERVQALGLTDHIPGFGVAARTLRETAGPRHRAKLPRVQVKRGLVTNDLISMFCDAAGLHLATIDGHELHGVLGFESEGERGDLYTHSPIPGTLDVGQLRAHRVTMRGPLRAALTMRWRVPVAARETTRATGLPAAHRATSIDLHVVAELDAGAPCVRLRIAGHNAADDYRLRVVVRTGIAGTHHVADAAFGLVTRSAVPAEALPQDVEQIPPTHPLHRYLSCDDGRRGFTVVSDGLAEYEASANGEIRITLLRAVGELSRADLPERPGHAGWPAATPLAQGHGPIEAMFALFPHGPRSPRLIDQVERVVDDVLTPLQGETLRASSLAGRSASFTKFGVALRGEGLRFEACKPAQSESGMVLRCTNLLDRVVEGEWHVPGARVAWLARLDETLLGVLQVRDERIRFYAQPRVTTTLLVRGES